MNLTRIYQVLEEGIAAIKKEQSPDGSFSSTTGYRTTFLAANILSCLNAVDTLAFDTALAMPEFGCMGNLMAIRKMVASFLLNEKSENASFNYWASDTPEKKTMPYPDDLDDTFVALAALNGYDPAILGGVDFAKI